MNFSFSIEGIDEACDRLEESLNETVQDGVLAAAAVVAETARVIHPYENRTGNLEASTQAGESGGSFLHDTLYGEVVADALNTQGEGYGSYVEEKGFEFLGPAWDLSQEAVAHEMDKAAQAAVTKAFG